MAQFVASLVDGVSGPAGAASKAVSGLGDGMFKLARATGGARNESGQFISKAEFFAQLGPYGIAAAALAVAIAAVGVALYSMASAAVSITQERDKLKSTFDALGTGANAGQKTLDMLDKMSQKLPFTSAQLSKMAQGLMAAGIQGNALQQGVKAIASATAIMGETGGAAAEKLIKKLAEAAETGQHVKVDKAFEKQLAAAGVSAEALAKTLGTTPGKLASMNLSAQQLGDAMQKTLIQKGKGPLEDLGLTWESISGKLGEGISSMFEGVGGPVKEFMKSVQSLFGEFNRGSTITGAAKGTITSMLTTVFAVATRVVNGIHLGFLKLYILWLQAKAKIKPITDAIGSILPAGTGMSILMGIVKGLAVVFGILAVAIFISLLPLLILVAACVLVGFVIYELISAIMSIGSALLSMASGAIDAAENFISGLVNGIKNGAAKVVAAVVSLAKGAVGALSSALHLGSPSKLTMKMGGFTTEGLAKGLESGTADVHAAAKGAGKAAISGTAAGLDGADGKSGASAKGSGGAVTVNVQPGAVVIQGAGGDIMTLTEDAIAMIFEKMALRSGLVST